MGKPNLFATLGRMQIYAHRGASADFPELTLAAYEGAVAQGADGFECDLRLTKDEVPVLWHNASMLERAGNPGLIAEMTFAEVSRAYPQILTLAEFLDFAVSKKKGVLLETKHPVISGNRIEEVIAQTLAATSGNASIDVSVMSFSWGAIEKVKRLDSSLPTTFLMHHKTPFTLARLSSAAAIGPGIDLLREKPELASNVGRGEMLPCVRMKTSSANVASPSPGIEVAGYSVAIFNIAGSDCTRAVEGPPD